MEPNHPEKQLEFPISEKAYYVFSYMAHTDIYDQINLKKKLAKTILSKKGEELVSYTHSTIIFKAEFGEAKFNEFKDALTKICNGFTHKVFFSFTMAHATKTDINYIVWSGDAELNNHFQDTVKQAKTELRNNT